MCSTKPSALVEVTHYKSNAFTHNPNKVPHHPQYMLIAKYVIASYTFHVCDNFVMLIVIITPNFSIQLEKLYLDEIFWLWMICMWLQSDSLIILRSRGTSGGYWNWEQWIPWNDFGTFCRPPPPGFANDPQSATSTWSTILLWGSLQQGVPYIGCYNNCHC